jgi:hypothetical protein
MQAPVAGFVPLRTDSESIMRWLLLAFALALFGLAGMTRSGGMLAFCVVFGLVVLFAAFFAFVAEKISATARPDAALLTDKDINVLRASVRKPVPPSTPAPAQALDTKQE